MYTVLVPSLYSLAMIPFTFRTISVTSSFTPGIELNSCCTPAILMLVTAVPGKEDSRIRRRELPNVVPWPRSNGSTMHLP